MGSPLIAEGTGFAAATEWRPGGCGWLSAPEPVLTATRTCDDRDNGRSERQVTAALASARLPDQGLRLCPSTGQPAGRCGLHSGLSAMHIGIIIRSDVHRYPSSQAGSAATGCPSRAAPASTTGSQPEITKDAG